MEIKDYHIEMLSVGAADAFIIYIIDKNDNDYIIMIDSGNYRAQRVYDLNGKNLLDLIDELDISRYEKFAEIIWRKSPVTNKLVYYVAPSGFYGFTIIGPTKKYYEQLIPDFRDDLKHYDGDESYDSNSDIQNGNCLSPTLDEAADDSSAHNQSSIMILFEPKVGQKYFFMGDAGRDAFNNIHSVLKNKIKGVSWLKVPHHGSKHNMDSTMINWINPQTAYISTERVGNYLNMCTVNALKRNDCRVYSTHKAYDMIHKQIDERPEYSKTEPL